MKKFLAVLSFVVGTFGFSVGYAKHCTQVDSNWNTYVIFGMEFNAVIKTDTDGAIRPSETDMTAAKTYIQCSNSTSYFDNDVDYNFTTQEGKALPFGVRVSARKTSGWGTLGAGGMQPTVHRAQLDFNGMAWHIIKPSNLPVNVPFIGSITLTASAVIFVLKPIIYTLAPGNNIVVRSYGELALDSEKLSIKQKFPSQFINQENDGTLTKISVSQNRTVFLATDQNKLFMLKGDSLTKPIVTPLEFPDPTAAINDLATNEIGTVYVATDKGLYIASKQDDYNVTPVQFGGLTPQNANIGKVTIKKIDIATDAVYVSHSANSVSSLLVGSCDKYGACEQFAPVFTDLLSNTKVQIKSFAIGADGDIAIATEHGVSLATPKILFQQYNIIAAKTPNAIVNDVVYGKRKISSDLQGICPYAFVATKNGLMTCSEDGKCLYDDASEGKDFTKLIMDESTNTLYAVDEADKSLWVRTTHDACETFSWTNYKDKDDLDIVDFDVKTIPILP